MALQALPSINYVYADEKGNIGYVYNAQFPNRTVQADWAGILPGDRSDLIWNGYLPFDKVPQIWNPKSGYVFNSNNTPFDATAPADDLKPADFPASMGIQTNTTNRAMRAQETFGADASITADEFAAYKFDIAYSRRSEVAALMGELIALDAKGDADILAAQKILKGWDLKTDVKNRGAAMALLVAQPVLTAREKHQTPDLRAALTTAIGTLKKHFKRLDPEWGEVNRIRHGDVDLGIDGGPDTYRAVYGEPQKNGKLTAKAGDTFIMFVTWDKAGKLSSQSIHQFGAATSDPDRKSVV
jgi:penicillin amidase/acyl-homoserine-lactone acylase